MDTATLEKQTTPQSATEALRVTDLTHHYPKRRGENAPQADRPALKNLSFTVNTGEIFGILGPNGGGKTTLFKIIATLLRPTEGTVTVSGHDAIKDPRLVRQHLGVVFQSPSLDLKLTASENLMHHGHLYGITGKDLQDRQAHALDRVGLTDRAHDFVETFSGGMRRRVEIAKAMLHQPRVLLLDEPDTGLDPSARRDLWQHLKTLRNDFGVTVLMTTHLMEEAQKCDRLAIVNKGQLVALDTPDNLKSHIGGDVITIHTTHPSELVTQIAEQFKMQPDSDELKVREDHILVEHPDGPAMVAQLGALFGKEIQRITVGRPTLEDVFVHMTGDTLSDAS